MPNIRKVEGFGPVSRQPSPVNKPTSAQSLSLQNTLVHIFENPEASFLAMSDEAVSFLQVHCPSEMQDLEKLVSKEKVAISLLKEKGWKSLKAELGSDMAKATSGLSIEQLRGEIVQKVTTLCVAAMLKIGIDPPGRHLASGTPGWNSDIDTVYEAAPNMSQKMQSVEKILFDAIFYGIFERSSGEMFDTESYLNHPGASCNTESHMSTRESIEMYSHLELNAGVLQLLQQGSKQPEEWHDFRKMLIMEAGDKLRIPLSQALTQVELLEEWIQKGVDDLCKQQSFPSPQIAMMTYKAPVIIKLGEAMDKAYSELDQLGSREKSTPGLSQNPKHIEEIERLRLRIANLALIRTRFFDEGYNSQGAFNKICDMAGGQKHQRSIETYQRTVRKLYEEHSQQQLLQQLSTTRIHRQDAQRTSSTSLQEAISSIENLAMYRGHFHHALHGSESLEAHQKALLSQSKYSERTLESTVIIFNELEKTGFQDDALKKELNDTYQIASEMEKVKRKFFLNTVTTRALLTKALTKAYPHAPISKIEKWVEMVLSKNELTKQKLRWEESILPEDMYVQMVSVMEHFDKKLVQVDNEYFFLATIKKISRIFNRNKATHSLPSLTNKEVEAILKARCGLNASDPEVQKLHQQGDKITLEAYGFTSLDTISSFNKRVESLTMKVYSLALSTGIIPVPKPDVPSELLIASLWQDVIGVPEDPFGP